MAPDHPIALDQAELARYDRQIRLGQIGRGGQVKLKSARVLVVGAGGLGSSAAIYLAAAGVGVLGLAEPDRVEASNLNRQILHGTADLGREKLASARFRIEALNPLTKLEALPCRLAADNADALVERFDLVLGCVDNFAARYLLNAACVRQGKPNIFGAAALFEGQAGVFCLPDGPCYQCFFQETPNEGTPPPPEEIGVLGVVPGIIGCIQAAEAIKVILGIGRPLSGRLLLFDALTLKFRELAVKKDPKCPACGKAKKPPPR